MGYNSTGLVVHDADAHIMETPNWLRDHADPAVRESDRTAAVSGRQRAPPDRRSPAGRRLRPRRGVRSARRPPALRRADGGRGRRDHAAQELRRHRRVRRRRPAAGPRPARLRQPTRVQHVPQPAPARLGALGRRRDRRSAPPAPTTAGWPSSARSTIACCRRCTCRCATSNGRPHWRPRRIGHGRRRTLVASGCPPGHSPSHRGLDGVWAAACEAGIPIVFHVGGTGDLIDPQLLRQRAAGPAGLPRRRGELPLRRLHGHPRSARPDAGHDDLRRRVRTLPDA